MRLRQTSEPRKDALARMQIWSGAGSCGEDRDGTARSLSRRDRQGVPEVRKLRIPLFITCQNPRCGKLKQVRKPCEQHKTQYCSRSCASVMNASKEHCRAGGLERARRARLKIRQRVDGLAPIEAFRLGYTLGLRSKTRQLQRMRRPAA